MDGDLKLEASKLALCSKSHTGAVGGHAGARESGHDSAARRALSGESCCRPSIVMDVLAIMLSHLTALAVVTNRPVSSVQRV